jgi:glycerol kinase
MLYEPTVTEGERARLYRRWRRALKRSKEWERDDE